MTKFLVVIDTQVDFMLPAMALPVLGADRMIPLVNKFLATLDPVEYSGVLFTHDTHAPEVYKDSEEAKAFPIHCVKGTPGWENVFNPGIIKNIDVCFLEKGVFNMWEESSLDITSEEDPLPRDFVFEAIKKYGVEEIEIMGVAADYCVFWAIQGFVERGFKVTVLEDFVAGINRSIEQVIHDEFKDTDNVHMRRVYPELYPE